MVGRKPSAAFATLALAVLLVLSGCAAPAKPTPASREIVEPIVSDGVAADAEAPPEEQVESEAQESEAEASPEEAASPPSQAPPPPEPEEAEPEATTLYEKRLDVLLEKSFVNLPDVTGLLSATFDVEHPYQTLEVVGKYGFGEYVSWLTVEVQDASGKTVIAYDQIDSHLVATGTGGSGRSFFPIGYAYDIEPGTYTVNVWGVGTIPVTLVVRGHLGADMDFTFANVVTGSVDKVSNYRGKVLLVDLMATWCGPCKAAMPGLKEIREDYQGKIEILSIDVDNSETHDELRDMRDEYGATWPFGFDHQDEATEAFGTGWIPSFGIIDQHGVLLFRHIGEMEDQDMRDIIDYALAER